jgi:hypothetical protein
MMRLDYSSTFEWGTTPSPARRVLCFLCTPRPLDRLSVHKKRGGIGSEAKKAAPGGFGNGKRRGPHCVIRCQTQLRCTKALRRRAASGRGALGSWAGGDSKSTTYKLRHSFLVISACLSNLSRRSLLMSPR